MAFVRSGRPLVLRWGLPILESGQLGPFPGINLTTPVKVSPPVVIQRDTEGIRQIVTAGEYASHDYDPRVAAVGSCVWYSYTERDCTRFHTFYNLFHTVTPLFTLVNTF